MTEAKKTERSTSRAGKPIVVDSDYEYTKGLQNFQESEKSYSEALQKVSNAISSGVDSYLNARHESASKKKDGALEDWFVNSAKGVSVAVEESGSAIYDVAKSIDSYFIPDRQRKSIKKSIRSLSRLRLPIIPVPFFVGYDDDDDDDDED